jgi:alkylation response protein AidB-like acyl-CoA dehydrogenase
MQTTPLLQGLAPFFQTEKGEYTNTISPELLHELFERNLFKLFLPKTLGGLELGMVDTLAVIRDAAYLNGSLGWLIQIGNGGMYFATNFPEELATEFFTPKNAVIAGSGTVNGTCVDVEGGVRINGSWQYCSGSAYATLFTVTIMRQDGTVCAAILPREEVTILNDWNTIGLSQTSTNTIVLDNVFVPHHRLFNVFERKSYTEYAVFNLPFLIYAQAFFSSVAFGIFSRLLHEANMVATRKHPENIALNEAITSGEELLNDALKQSTVIVNELIAKRGVITTEEEVVLQQRYKDWVKQVRNHAHELHAQMGMHGLFAQHTFTIFYLDLLAATQHKLLN